MRFRTLSMATGLLLGALVVASMAPSVQAQEGQPLILKVLDLPRHQVPDPGGFRLVPPIFYATFGNGQYSEVEAELDEIEALSDEFVMDLVREVVQPDQWDLHGRWLESESQRRELYVRAPRALVEEVERVITFLSRRFHEPIPVTVTVYTVDPDASFLEELDGAIVATGAADRILMRAQESRQLDAPLRKTLSLRPGVPALESSQIFHHFMLDFEVEIAEAAAIGDPVSGIVGEGVTVQACAGRAHAGGVSLDLGLRVMDLESLSHTDVSGSAMIHGGDRPLYSSLPTTLQTPDRAFVSAVSSFHLPEGKSAFLLCASRLYSGKKGYLVRVDASEGEVGPKTLDLAGGRTLAVFGQGARGTGRIGVSPARASDLSSRAIGEDGDEEGPPHVAHFVGQDFDSFRDFVTVMTDLEDDEGRMWSVANRLVVAADAEKVAAVEKTCGLLEERGLQGGTLEFSLARGGEASSTVIGRVMLPVSMGASFATVIGNQTLDVLDADVEVAQRAMVADPWVAVMYDAFQIHGRVDRRSGGEVGLEMCLKMNALAGTPTLFDPEVEYMGNVVQPSFSTVWVERILDLTPGEPQVMKGLAHSVGAEDLVLTVVYRK